MYPDEVFMFTRIWNSVTELFSGKNMVFQVLVGKDGQVIGRYPPTTNPKDLASIIEKNL